MAFSFNKLKNLLKVKRGDEKLAGSGSLDPEIGFKLSYNAVLSTVKVTVIGARHLPSYFGLTAQAHGYVVKVKMFPGETKYESKLEESSWPIWNEEFTFQLNKPKSKSAKCKSTNTEENSGLAGKFVSLTVYALLEQPRVEPEKASTMDKKTPKVSDSQEAKPKRAFLEKISSFKTSKSEAVSTVPKRYLLEKRRTIGVVTWNLDHQLFHNDLKNGYVGTPDIWRPIVPIASGHLKPDDNAGQVEVSLLYTSSEDGLRDILQITVHRFRCSVHVMQEQEKHKEPLYLKAAILEAHKAEASWKSDLFIPTISTRWEPNVAVVKLQVFRAHIDKVTSYISLGCKNKMGKKIMLGKITFAADDQIWTPSIRAPGVARTTWLSLLPAKGEKIDD